MRVNDKVNLTIDKLVFGGQGISHYEDRTIFVWNALPGEQVEAEIIKKRKGVFEAVAKTIIKPAEYRVEPAEKHFLSSCPWSIMTFEKENEFKKTMALETYNYLGGLDLIDLDIYYNDDQQVGYRNKIEFSFFEFNEDDERGTGVSLSFFQRGMKYKEPVAGSVLAEPVINESADYILKWINAQSLTRYQLKSLIIRSNGKGEAIAALFCKDKVDFSDYPKLNDKLLGFHIYFSNPKSPASVPTEIMYSEGQDFLSASINDTNLDFGLLGFFQVNIPVFNQALQDVSKYLDKSRDVIDYYSGVGAISLPLHEHYQKAILVENNEEAVEFAKKNIISNGISNAEVHLTEAENMTEIITSEHVVIVDPPRAGLHKNVIDTIIDEKPVRIIYMSCNLSTQARDIKLLAESYEVEFIKLYNFFPCTPHVESVCVLNRKI